MMANSDPEGQIVLSYPHTNNGFFFLLNTVFICLFIYLSVYLLIFFKIIFHKSLNIHTMTLLDVLGKIACGKLRFSIKG